MSLRYGPQSRSTATRSSTSLSLSTSAFTKAVVPTVMERMHERSIAVAERRVESTVVIPEVTDEAAGDLKVDTTSNDPESGEKERRAASVFVPPTSTPIL